MSFNFDTNTLKYLIQRLKESFALKTELHEHTNKDVLDTIDSNKISSWNNKSEFSGNYNDLTNKPTIPTKTSDITNDSGYITSIPSEYVTESELNSKGYLTSVPSAYVTEEELNAKGYLTEHQSLEDYALKTEIPSVPTKTSQLTNDSNFISSIPSEYITETELSSKGYLTQHQDINGKVDKINGKGLSTNDYTTEEKNKLNGIEENANNYSLPIASSTTLGGIKIGSGLSIDSNGVLSSNDGSSDLSNYQTKTDNTLTTTDKTIVGAINELDIESIKAEDFEDNSVVVDNNLTSRVSALEIDKADVSSIPTKTSQLTNDIGYISSVPSEYVTETELNGKGYATETFVTETISSNEYVHPNTHPASMIIFTDGENFQNKLDAGTLKGEKGDIGEQGPKGDKGDKGDTGLTGANGLTTQVRVNGVTYTQVDGLITLPNYPETSSESSHTHSNKDVLDTITSDMTTKWNKCFIFEDSYTSDCNTWLTNGYTKTSTSTANHPSVCTGSDRWGILFFIAENASQGTGTQMYFPIDGTYEGRIFTRSIKIRTPNSWKLLAIESEIKSQSDDVTISTQSDTDIILQSPNGTKYRLVVSDDGTLSTEEYKS